MSNPRHSNRHRGELDVTFLPLSDLPELGVRSDLEDVIVVRPGSQEVPIAVVRFFGPEWLPFLAGRTDRLRVHHGPPGYDLHWLRAEYGPVTLHPPDSFHGPQLVRPAHTEREA